MKKTKMTISGLKLPLVLLVVVAPYFASSTPLQLEDMELSELDPATYQLLQNERLPDCPKPSPSAGTGTTTSIPSGGSASSGGTGGPSHSDEKFNFKVVVNGFCCETVSHTAPIGFEYMLVITHIDNIEPAGSMGFYDVTTEGTERLIRMIVKTEEGIEGDYDPPLMERSETGQVIGRFCGGPLGRSEFRYSLNAVPAD